MKPLTALVLFLATSPLVAHAQTVLSQEAVLSQLEQGSLAVLEQVRALPVSEADSLLREAHRRFQTDHPEAAQAAMRLLGELPGVAALYRERLTNLPLLEENTTERGTWMVELGKIPSRWALELLAGELDDKRSLSTNYDAITLQAYREQGGSSSTNADMAAMRLASLFADKLPVRKPAPLYTRKDIPMIRQWWEEHKNEPDSYFFGPAAATPALPKSGAAANPAQATQHSRPSSPNAADKESAAGNSTGVVIAIMAALLVVVLLPWVLRRGRRT